MLSCLLIGNRSTQTRKKIKSTFINKNNAIFKTRDIVQKRRYLFFSKLQRCYRYAVFE